MRNLLEFPITENEVNEVMDRAIKRYEKVYGGIDVLVLSTIKLHIQDPQIMKQIVDSMDFGTK